LLFSLDGSCGFSFRMSDIGTANATATAGVHDKRIFAIMDSEA